MNDQYGLETLWPWLCGLAHDAKMQPEDVVAFNKVGIINAYGGNRTDWGHAQSDAIRGIPFSAPMEYFLGDGINGDVVRALYEIRPSTQDPYQLRNARKSQWRIVASIIKFGGTDTETCRTTLNRQTKNPSLVMDEYKFRVAATSGILALRSSLDREATR